MLGAGDSSARFQAGLKDLMFQASLVRQKSRSVGWSNGIVNGDE